MEPGFAATIVTNVAMILALLAAARIFWLGFRRYRTDSRWQLVMLGGLLLVAGYVAIMMLNGGPTADIFQALRTGAAGPGAYVIALKAGLLLAILGLFGVAKGLEE